ncbi:MAG: VanZ family protein [Lachnospiraceae bacterium]|nr:VanZ family protein [Lachnospiraceae bacterium]
MKKGKRSLQILAAILFVLYICLLFYLLFFSETYGRTMDSGYRYNLEPFKEIKRFWNNRDTLGISTVITNLIGNIVAFAPFGFFLPIFFKIGKNLFGCLFVSALFSLAVETVQLFTKVGAFDVDDILLNAVGGFVGWICFYLFWIPLVKKK